MRRRDVSLDNPLKSQSIRSGKHVIWLEREREKEEWKRKGVYIIREQGLQRVN